MQENWTRAIAWVLEEERGSGLSLEEHNAYRDAHFNPRVERVTQAERHEIETIYRLSYWMPYGDVLPSGLDFFYFDVAVVYGVPAAIKSMQRALGVEPDGHIGVVTTQAIVQAVRDKKIGEVLDRWADATVNKYDPIRTDQALKHAKELLR